MPVLRQNVLLGIETLWQISIHSFICVSIQSSLLCYFKIWSCQTPPKGKSHPGCGKTTGDECLPLFSSLITDEECRLSREHWCLTGQILSSSFNCLNKMLQDPLVNRDTITFAINIFLFFSNNLSFIDRRNKLECQHLVGFSP